MEKKSEDIYMYISIGAAWIAYAIVPYNKGLAIFFGVLSVVFILLMLISSIRTSIKEQLAEQKGKLETVVEPNRFWVKPILPEDASASEVAVMHVLYRKITEYQKLDDGMYCGRLYNGGDTMMDYKGKLDAIKRELNDISYDLSGNLCFCRNSRIHKWIDVDRERMIHYSTYFNDKCDEIIKKSYVVGLEKSGEQIALLADYMLNNLGVTLDFKVVSLKMQELDIRYNIARLKEEQRQAEQEERKAQRDYERALKDAARNEEKARLELDKQREALEKAASEQEKVKLQEKITTLEERLQDALAMKERAMSMAQQTRTGYVYVISNVRSFGEDIYKIGMTRRLEPMDRVRELGDASVPFPFDVHYMIYTDDAPKLEAELHQRFAECKMNSDNYRKEFFRIPLGEIEDALRELKMIE